MNTKQLKRDLITFAALLVFALILYFVLIPQQIMLRNSWSGDVAFTSQTFPQLLAICLCVVSSLGILQSARKLYAAGKREGERAATPKISPLGRLFPLFAFLVCILYVILFTWVGFVAASVIVMPVMLLLFGSRKWHHFVSVYAFAAFLYIMFKMVLKVPLP